MSYRRHSVDWDDFSGFFVYLGVNAVWLVFCIIVGFTSPVAAGDLFYFNLYLWPFAVGGIFFALSWTLLAARDYTERLGLIGSAVTAIVFVYLIWFGFSSIYQRLYALKSTVVEVPYAQSEFIEGHAERFMPYPVAAERMKTVQGDTQGASLINVTYVHDPVNGSRWTAIADANTLKTTTKAVVVIAENGDEFTCSIKIPPITNGYLWHNMQNRIRKEDFTYFIEPDDVYGDCVNGEAIIVVPLQKTSGPRLVSYPAGVAVFDSSGEAKIYDNGEIPENIYGPSYPMSLAAKQRKALMTGYGFWAYMFSEFGYESTEDELSPNLGNESEFNLVGRGEYVDDMFYVSPLTPKGTSQSIVGNSIVSSRMVSPNQYNTLYFVRYPSVLDGLQTLSDNVMASHNEIDWASGLRPFEIVPGPDDTFVGYVGRGTIVRYLFTFYPDRPETYVTIGDEEPNIEESPLQPASDQPTNIGDCDVLWQKLEEASASRDFADVLFTMSELARNNCK